MMNSKRDVMRLLIPLGAAATLLTGCPERQDVFDVWILNTSNNVAVTNVKITNTADEDKLQEFPEDLAPNMGRVIADIEASPFEGGTVTLAIQGETGGEILENVDATVLVDEPIREGSVVAVVVRGNSVLDFDAEFVPLEDSSKGLMLLRQHLRGTAMAN